MIRIKSELVRHHIVDDKIAPARVAAPGASPGYRLSTAGIIERTARAASIEIEIMTIKNPDDVRAAGGHATPGVIAANRTLHDGDGPSHEKERTRRETSGVGFIDHPTRYLFFTGKGGVGKTSLSSAAAVTLADAGKRVLLVSTDAASNLDEMLGIELRNSPVAVPGAPGLSVVNIDPDNAAESYRRRVLAQMEASATAAEMATVREQLSGACTTEIASFDEFSSLLAEGARAWDHVVFDTAPTGHTLRLLSLPKAWTGFLDGNDRGASCLGPHSGLKMQEARFKAALDALSDPTRTTVVLVTRPDRGAIDEAARSSAELRELGLNNQRLAVNRKPPQVFFCRRSPWRRRARPQQKTKPGDVGAGDVGARDLPPARDRRFQPAPARARPEDARRAGLARDRDAAGMDASASGNASSMRE